MNNQRLMQFFISGMAVFSTIMLGTSQENSAYPLIGFVAATFALCFTDWLGWISLHPIIAGILGLIAGAFAFQQSHSAPLADQFVAVANLLIHLQIILLLQKKSVRIYWQLITLSLLQVVVAAALNLFVLFGPLLVLYTIFAIMAMILFFVYRETFPFVIQDELAESKNKKKRNSRGDAELIQLVSMTNSRQIAEQPRRKIIRRSGFRSFFMLAVSTVIASLAVFLLMPRFGDGVWRPNNTKVGATGFDGDSVDLEDVGSLYENPSVVMRVSFTDAATGDPYPITGSSPYFRGTALGYYEFGKGRWTRRFDLRDRDFDPLPRPQRLTSAVRQTVNFEIAKKDVVFNLAPAVSLEDTPRTMLGVPRTNEVRYFPKPTEDPASYAIGTTSLVNGFQSQFTPATELTLEEDVNWAAVKVERNLPRLTALATDLVQNISSDDQLARARRLERYFTNRANGFTYSLDGPGQRTPGLDPVEDFLINQKKGHCQYYASALALMLRSLRIPSRVVIGYRCENYNVVGNYYQVREMDAHAWVEARIESEQIPKEIMPREGITGDAWVRLDPTPGGDIQLTQTQISPWRAKLGDTLDYMQLLWSDYVLGLNEKRQQRRIYEPLQAFFQNSTALIFSPDVWAARWESLVARFQGDLFSRENIRDSSLAVALFLIAMLLARFLWRLFARYFAAWRNKNRSVGTRVDFYVKFEKLLAKYGLRREQQQTHREFAGCVKKRLQDLGVDSVDPADKERASLGELPDRVVDLFYRVRFGDNPVDTMETERLESSLVQLQRFLAAPPQRVAT